MGMRRRIEAPGARRGSGDRVTTMTKKSAEAQQASADYQEAARRRPQNRRNTRRLPRTRRTEIEHLAQLHDSGALTDEEFAAAKAKVLGT